MTNNISFQSRIKPVQASKYKEQTQKITEKFFVDFPWTINEAVKSKQAYTADVWDCSVLGITNKKEVLLLHLCPSVAENLDFNKIKNFIKKKVKLGSENLQAVLLGSQLDFQNSKPLNDFLKNLMKDLGIPCSVLTNSTSPFNVAYSSNTDEWLISMPEINRDILAKDFSSEEILRRSFKEVELSSLDEFA